MNKKLAWIKTFFLRQAIVPFETTLAFFFMYAAVASMVGFGTVASPLSRALGTTMATLFNVVYLVAGLGMFVGIGTRRGDLEAFGLILVITSLAVRTVATGWLIVINPQIVYSYVSSGVFIFACVIRMTTILKAQKMLNGSICLSTT